MNEGPKRVCSKCKVLPRLVTRSGNSHSWCRECSNAAKRQAHNKDPERLSAIQKRCAAKIVTDNKAKLAELKDRPCMDCGVKYPPYVMHFDHRDPSGKRLAVSAMIGTTYAWETVLQEVAKCDLVCSNCHAERTWGVHK